MKNTQNKKNKKEYFEYYADVFLKTSKIKNKESTYSNYYYVINSKVLPYFKDYKIKSITNDTIINYTNTLISKKLSSKTIKDTLTILYGILKKYNKKIERTYPRINKNEIKVLENNDQILLESYIVNNLNNITFLIYLSLYTGLRIGEVCALKWSNIDLDEGKVTINSTITRVLSNNKKNKTKIIITDAKTINSVREIPLNESILKLAKKVESSSKTHYISTNSPKFMEPRLFYNKYKSILKELNIDKYNFHALRHIFATRCINSGADPKTLSLILEHSSVKITLDRYVHTNFKSKVTLISNLKLLYQF